MQIRTIIVLLFTLSLSVLPVKAGVEVQPRIVTLKDKVESLESEYGVRFVYSSDINLERPYIGGRPDASKILWNQAVPKALKLPLTGCSEARESAGRSTAGT